MPLFFQQDINYHTRLAVWHITEDEPFFEKLAVPQRPVAHPHKRLQHLAGRYLLRYLFPEFPTALIRIADTRKPFLEDEAFHFSISHCSDYAAVVVSRSERVGVDIEVVTEKAVRIRRKFASEEEWAIVNRSLFFDNTITQNDAVGATLIWSGKEAVFKWYGSGEVDFKGHIQIRSCKKIDATFVKMEVMFQKEKPQMLLVHSRLINGLWLSYIVE